MEKWRKADREGEIGRDKREIGRKRSKKHVERRNMGLLEEREVDWKSVEAT